MFFIYLSWSGGLPAFPIPGYLCSSWVCWPAYSSWGAPAQDFRSELIEKWRKRMVFHIYPMSPWFQAEISRKSWNESLGLDFRKPNWSLFVQYRLPKRELIEIQDHSDQNGLSSKHGLAIQMRKPTKLHQDPSSSPGQHYFKKLGQFRNSFSEGVRTMW